MRLICVGYTYPVDIDLKSEERRIAFDFIHPNTFFGRIESRIHDIWADAVIVISDPSLSTPGLYVTDVPNISAADKFDLSAALSVVRSIRGFADDIAMGDGRKWKSIPCIILGSKDDFSKYDLLGSRYQALDFEAIELEQVDKSIDPIVEVVKKYRQKILDDFDNLGFIVSYESGRYRLGPALSSRNNVESAYYHGPADSRGNDRIVTIDRDNLDIQVETEKFEFLINKPDVSEEEIHAFLEEHPHFISRAENLLSKPRFSDSAQKLLIPDFIAKPLVAEQRDDRWKILELKRPQVPILVGKENRRWLSSEVMKAIRQLKDYRDYFLNPQNKSEIKRVLGHELRYPKLGVLIGRLPKGETNDLDREQKDLSGVSRLCLINQT